MQTVVIIIMLLTVVSFLVKLSFHRPAGIAVLTLVCALFTGLGYDYAASQSKAQIADWLMQPELMLDISVILTVDVAMQIAFCFLWGRRVDGPAASTSVFCWCSPTGFRVCFCSRCFSRCSPS